MTNTNIVTVDHVAKSFTDDAGELPVLRDVNFTLSKGDMVSLVGVSGVGKTTLLQILGGLDRATGGSVTIGDRNLSALSGRELAAFRSGFIGFVFQFHHLLPDFTALENTFIPGLIAGKKQDACVPRARELLNAVGLDMRSTHYPGELSGGERQRVALARALFNNPALILADEPTGNLDTQNGGMLLELFHRMNREFGQTFLIATHNAQLSGGLKRTLYLENGAIREETNH